MPATTRTISRRGWRTALMFRTSTSGGAVSSSTPWSGPARCTIRPTAGAPPCSCIVSDPEPGTGAHTLTTSFQVDLTLADVLDYLHPQNWPYCTDVWCVMRGGSWLRSPPPHWFREEMVWTAPRRDSSRTSTSRSALRAFSPKRPTSSAHLKEPVPRLHWTSTRARSSPRPLEPRQ